MHNPIQSLSRRGERHEGRAVGEDQWATGYAKYEPDDTVDDVFRRADHNMYGQKKCYNSPFKPFSTYLYRRAVLAGTVVLAQG